jgi:hypothetical protein
MGLAGSRTTRLTIAVLAALVSACGEGGTEPGSLRFGQLGEVRLHIATPLLLGQGELQQSLTWNSSGPWQLTEAIAYRGEPGDTNTFVSVMNPEVLAGSYAVWITQINDIQSLRLFIPDLDQTLDPDCGPSRSRVTLRIRDAVLSQEARWARCVEGGLSNLATGGAGPDPAAGRVANAALLLRDYTLPATFLSSFHGSYPFATLVRGDHTPVLLDAPVAIESTAAWAQFWTTHTGSVVGLPAVDFSRDVVLAAGIGRRFEAGESVEVRRVLPVGEGTIVEVVWRVPGNFCSPVNREHRPFHVVVAPKVPTPIVFAQTVREEVPCGVR